jgi:hypothetical protein
MLSLLKLRLIDKEARPKALEWTFTLRMPISKWLSWERPVLEKDLSFDYMQLDSLADGRKTCEQRMIFPSGKMECQAISRFESLIKA